MFHVGGSVCYTSDLQVLSLDLPGVIMSLAYVNPIQISSMSYFLVVGNYLRIL